MLEKIFNNKGFSILAKIFIIIGFILLVTAVSLTGFTFGYWLITLILADFFTFYLPFSFTYAFGGGMIGIIVSTIFLPFVKFTALKFK